MAAKLTLTDEQVALGRKFHNCIHELNELIRENAALGNDALFVIVDEIPTRSFSNTAICISERTAGVKAHISYSKTQIIF